MQTLANHSVPPWLQTIIMLLAAHSGVIGEDGHEEAESDGGGVNNRLRDRDRSAVRDAFSLFVCCYAMRQALYSSVPLFHPSASQRHLLLDLDSGTPTLDEVGLPPSLFPRSS